MHQLHYIGANEWAQETLESRLCWSTRYSSFARACVCCVCDGLEHQEDPYLPSELAAQRRSAASAASAASATSSTSFSACRPLFDDSGYGGGGGARRRLHPMLCSLFPGERLGRRREKERRERSSFFILSSFSLPLLSLSSSLLLHLEEFFVPTKLKTLTLTELNLEPKKKNLLNSYWNKERFCAYQLIASFDCTILLVYSSV